MLHPDAQTFDKDRGMKYSGLSWVLALQIGLAPGYAQAPSPQELNITIVEGEGAINNVRQRVSRDIIVQVDDWNKRPVVGAAVAFTLPSEGAGGTFSNGQTTLTAVTDQQGRAIAHGFRPNNATGKMEIRVNASWQGHTARATITQFNMLVEGAGTAKPKKFGTGKIVAILLVAGAAAAGGTLAATRKTGSQTAAPAATPTVITITPGTGTIAPPQ